MTLPPAENNRSVLILGSGIAGLSAALKFAADPEMNAQIYLVCKSELSEGATRYAQGGIASVWSKQDSFAEHKRDTHVAGAGLCHENIVDLCVREGPARLQELIDWGVQFTKRDPATLTDEGVDPAEVFSLHREGGHGKRRILHANDLTGWEIERALIAQVKAHSQIKIFEYHTAIDLITEGKLFKRWRAPGRCLGAYVLNNKTGKVLTFPADVTVLACGGAGKVYLYTTNPDTSTGDGISMAHRAGAQVANLEFMQFHPTCLYHPSAKTFLITEAMRGEGAILKNARGESFMEKYHEMASLAPRDIVARSIDFEMKRTGDKFVLLDATHLPAEELTRKFPNIHQVCLQYGIDMTKQPIPVVPACHYTCGGVKVDEWAKTNVDGLYAVGEVASTGLHGANRLASNSLLEAIVFSHRVAEHAREWFKTTAPQFARGTDPVSNPLPAWDTGHAVQIEEQIDITANWLEIRSLMWNYVGIVRSDQRLERALRRLELLKAEVNAYYWDFLLTQDLIELRNLLTVAELIVLSAMRRKESRGLHYTVDHPGLDDKNFKNDTIL